jgi:hypothetical protein
MLTGPSVISAVATVQILHKDMKHNPTAVHSNYSLSSSSSEGFGADSTADFLKKGNIQNSPVPPECPKKGPIPPNCTLKPKF